MTKALLYDTFGGIEVLYIGELPHKDLSPRQVRVGIKAAALNPFDFKMRNGIVPMPSSFPHGVGNDFAGIVLETSEGSEYFNGKEIQVGDEVLGFADQIAVSEEIIVDAVQLAPKPFNLDWSIAGGLATAGLTADACMTALEIRSHDVVGVSAAAGSVGQIFCQLAVIEGAKVIGSASQSNQDFLGELGVNAVDYARDLSEQFKMVAPEGLTKFQDNFGRQAIDFALGLGLSPENICSIVDHSAVAELGLATPGRYERSASRLSQLSQMVSEDKLNLAIEAEYPLSDFREAFELLEGRHLRGKVVITF